MIEAAKQDKSGVLLSAVVSGLLRDLTPASHGCSNWPIRASKSVHKHAFVLPRA